MKFTRAFVVSGFGLHDASCWLGVSFHRGVGSHGPHFFDWADIMEFADSLVVVGRLLLRAPFLEWLWNVRFLADSLCPVMTDSCGIWGGRKGSSMKPVRNCYNFHLPAAGGAANRFLYFGGYLPFVFRNLYFVYRVGFPEKPSTGNMRVSCALMFGLESANVLAWTKFASRMPVGQRGKWIVPMETLWWVLIAFGRLQNAFLTRWQWLNVALCEFFFFFFFFIFFFLCFFCFSPGSQPFWDSSLRYIHISPAGRMPVVFTQSMCWFSPGIWLQIRINGTILG